MAREIFMNEPTHEHFVPPGDGRKDALAPSPVSARIDSLLQKSRYKRTTITSPECTIINDAGDPFTIKTAVDDETLQQIYDLLAPNFSSNELQNLEELQAALRGRTRFGTDAPGIDRAYTIRNQEGKLISVLTATTMPLRDEHGIPLGKFGLLRGYSATDPSARKTGFARELQISALIDAANIAQQKNGTLAAVASESVASAEPAWNSVDLERVYFGEKNNPNTLYELPYYQLPLEYNPDTGHPAANAGKAAEHLMIDTFGEPVDKGLIVGIVGAYQEANSVWPARAFNNAEAHRTHRTSVAQGMKEFRDFIYADNRNGLVTLKAAAREAHRAAGFTIHDHVAAG